ncbi:hypothetical protein FB45DRAFT_862739 [Roridomyces roridus]|uniref:Uncharacterized protein n=1 Tax=Roridomyces roridus TaxID=1738132 RepID=A0AAD7C8H1_9AGAR|nr:hypothetical protein FB45DRAFT_862739 [Roridomyces roridus]
MMGTGLAAGRRVTRDPWNPQWICELLVGSVTEIMHEALKYAYRMHKFPWNRWECRQFTGGVIGIDFHRSSQPSSSACSRKAYSAVSVLFPRVVAGTRGSAKNSAADPDPYPYP